MPDFALQGAEGDFALVDRSDGDPVMVGAAVDELAGQLSDRWPRVVEQVIGPVRRTGDPLLVVPASEADDSGDDLAKHIGSLLAVPLLEERTGGRVAGGRTGRWAGPLQAH